MVSNGELKCIGCNSKHSIAIDLNDYEHNIKKSNWDYLFKRWGCPRELRNVKPTILPYQGEFEYYCHVCGKHYLTRFIYFNRSKGIIGCYREEEEKKYEKDLSDVWRLSDDIRTTHQRNLRERFIKTFGKLVLCIHRL